MSSSGPGEHDASASDDSDVDLPPVSEQAAEVCEQLLGSAPDRIDTPGGQSRDAVRAWFGEQSLIVTRRAQLQRARLEAMVLRGLSQSGEPVPRLIASSGHWLLQQDLGVERLSQVLSTHSQASGAEQLERAVASLLSIQAAGGDLGFPDKIFTLGEREAWSRKLVNRRLAIDDMLSIQAPDLPMQKLHQLLRVREPTFLKWDARPGNAIVLEGGRVGWIDWEHCGVRNAVDDLVWLLADEYTPDLSDQEARLLDTWLAEFAMDWSADEARDYFFTFGVLHSLVRLGYILGYKADGLWWDPQRCLELDKVGVTRDHALRLCHRSRRWAGESSLLEDMVPWFDEVLQAIPA